MIPSPSPIPIRAEWTEKVARRTRPLEAYALGGPGIGVAVLGDFDVQWTFVYRDGAVYASSDDVAETELFRAADVTQISACFDQALNPIVGFFSGGRSYFWRISATGDRETVEVPTALSPFCQLDDKRAFARADSDVILSFVRGGRVIALAQREAFAVEHDMGSAGNNGVITALAPTTNYRLQWRIKENS